MDWSLFPNFEPHEFACQCGKCDREVDMDFDFMVKLQKLRDAFGRPMPVTSGYRCDLHPIKTPEHRAGMAADIDVRGRDARLLLDLAIEFPRIGIKQHGKSRFIHLGTMGPDMIKTSPWIWTYP